MAARHQHEFGVRQCRGQAVIDVSQDLGGVLAGDEERFLLDAGEFFDAESERLLTQVETQSPGLGENGRSRCSK